MMKKKIWALLGGSLLLFGACEVNVPINGEERVGQWAVKKTTELKTRLVSGGQAVRNNEGGQVYLISTWRDLEYISGNFTDNTELLEFDYVVTADITFPDLGNAPLSEDGMYATSGFIPIGTEEHPFSGTFDGGERTINHLVIDRKDSDSVGLFGRVQGIPEDKACIKGVRLEDIKVTGKNNVGALIGEAGNDIELENNNALGRVEGRENVGGAIGNIISSGNTQGTINLLIENIYANVEVVGETNIGGLIGNARLIGAVPNLVGVKNVYADGVVSGRNSVGGLIGSLSSMNIAEAYATGDVIGATEVGGLMGAAFRSGISASYAMGNVIGATEVGGLIGKASASSSISSSYATGNVTGTTDIGGLIGAASVSSSISSSYATGNVGGDTNVGGFIGNMDTASTIENSYSTADVNGKTNVHVFMGIRGNGTGNQSMSTSNFVQGENNDFMRVWLGENRVNVESVVGGGTMAAFGWTFEGENAMWHWLEDGKWPILKWQREAQGN